MTDKAPRPGSVDQHVLLAVMGLQPKAYGVSIQQSIRDEIGRSYSIGGIYAALDRLERQGFIKPKLGEPTPERGGRAKLYFNLTGTGQTVARAALNGLSQLVGRTTMVGAS